MTTSKKIIGKPKFGTRSVSILLLNSEHMPSDIEAVAGDLTRLRLGVSLGGREKHMRDSFIAAPFPLVVEILQPTSKLRRYSDIILEQIRTELSGIDSIVEQANHRYIRSFSPKILFPKQISGEFEPKDVWSAVIIAWALTEHPVEYWSGKMTLWEGFMLQLGIKLEQTRGMSPNRETITYQTMIERQLFADSRTQLFMELGAWIELDSQHKARMKQLASVGELYEAYAKIWMTLILLLATAGAAVWVKFVGDLLDGLIGLAAEIEKAKRDGVITEAESDGILIAGVFALLPFSSLLRGTLRKVADFFNLGILITMVGLILMTIFRELIYTLEKLERKQLAADAGFANIEEHALDQWVVIKYAE